METLKSEKKVDDPRALGKIVAKCVPTFLALEAIQSYFDALSCHLPGKTIMEFIYSC